MEECFAWLHSCIIFAFIECVQELHQKTRNKLEKKKKREAGHWYSDDQKFSH